MIKPLDPSFAAYIFAHQNMYPQAMQEEAATFERLLKGGFCWGYFVGEQLVGWVLFEKEDSDDYPNTLYGYDLAILPGAQRMGIGRKLWLHAVREIRWLGFDIHCHCRRGSYEIVTCYGVGYEIVMDKFIENHFAKEYEDDSLWGEHAHEVLLRRIGREN